MVDIGRVADDDAVAMPSLSVESHAPGMVDAESKGSIQLLGSEALNGLERNLLNHIIDKAEPGNPESVLKAMDVFWNQTFEKQGADKWNVRGQAIDKKLLDKVAEKTRTNPMRPVRCLEMGTYCGYSALRIAMSLPENGRLLSVEKDALLASIATKIIEFAGLDHKVKIWVGTVHSELPNIMSRLEHEPADFVLCDHSKDRYIPDLRLLEECGVVSKGTTVVGDLDVYPGDERLPREVQQEITAFFEDRDFVTAHLV
jgi:catechol O-methyltransferase